MPRILKDLQINEISSVSSGAGIGTRVLLRKSHQQESEMSKVEIVRKLATVSDFDLPEVVAKCVEADALNRADVYEVIKRRAFDKRKDGETFEQAFARITNPYVDPVGGALAKLHGSMRGPDHRIAKAGPDEGDADGGRPRAKQPKPKLGFGGSDMMNGDESEKEPSPSSKIESLVAQHMKDNPKKTRLQAYEYILRNEPGRSLLEADKASRM